jgi:membrane protein implicated in regulation of membrane protease activity
MVVTTAGVMWLMTGLICTLLGLIMPGFIMFFFGVGALFTALLSWLYPISIAAQLAVFLGASLAFLFLLRGVMGKIFPGKVNRG